MNSRGVFRRVYMENYIGIDLGGTNIRACLMDWSCKLRYFHKERTDPSKEPKRVAGQIVKIIRILQGKVKKGERVLGCCLGLAGLLSPDGRVVKIGPNFGWRDVPFADLLNRQLDMDILIVNDLTAVSYGEFKSGAGRGSKNMFCVFVGSGIGSALILNGSPYEGSTNVAGELGHIKVREGGRACGCGARGCLEAYTGGNPVRERIMDIARVDKDSFFYKAVGGRIEGLNYSYVEKGYLKGDAISIAIWEEIRDLLSMAIANVITVYNPDCVVIGGGAIMNTPRLLNAVMKDIRKYATPPSLSNLKIKKAILGDDAGMIGAALLMMNKKG
jgi:glucokinase